MCFLIFKLSSDFIAHDFWLNCIVVRGYALFVFIFSKFAATYFMTKYIVNFLVMS